MPWNIRFVSTYPPRPCGIGTFCRSLVEALEHFNAEVADIHVAVIDKNNGPYKEPVDIVIDQYDPQSWKDTTDRIIAAADSGGDTTVAVLQHEFGLDPDADGNDARGDNFVRMAKAFNEKGIATFVYFHTVLEAPKDHQKKIVQSLAEYADGLIVTTESAIDILESDTYGVDHPKLKHIDHGIRMHNPTQYDRFKIKSDLGLKDFFLATTLGLLSPAKGLQYSIPGYGRFINESCTDAQREQIVYLIAGQCHPEFVRAEEGKHYTEYMGTLDQALKKANVRWCSTDTLEGVDWHKQDIVLFDTFLDESTLLQIYAVTNCMILPYLNMEQISSGILADTVGSGRVAITTKFRYALELIYSNKNCPPGLVIGRFARGILVDPGPDSVEQIAQGLDYVVFEKEKRLHMEKQTHQRGYQMRWANSAWALLQYVQFISDEKEITTGRGIKFLREKPSVLQRKR
ncbi:MAG: glycosyltransferase family protein [Planctomycetota bacterium]|jgi:glycosyltransferase involved in cell wall biosynthesis